MFLDCRSEFDEIKACDARLAMHGRILRCPLGGNPEDCLFHDVRLLPVRDRVTWLESLSDEEVKKLYFFHCKCEDRKKAVVPAGSALLFA